MEYRETLTETKPQAENLREESGKGFRPFYLFPLSYVLSVYLFPLYIWLAGLHVDSNKNSGFVIILVMVLPVLCGILNIIAACVFGKPENRILMLHSAVLIKYAMIPFYLVGGAGLTLAFLILFIPVPGVNFLGPLISAMGAVVGWLILAFASPYTISYLCLSVKAGIRPKWAVVLHSILQFFFTADVIDVMILAWKEKKCRKLTVTVFVLFAVAVVALLLWAAVSLIRFILLNT